MDLGIGGVAKLIRDEIAPVGSSHFRGLLHCARHTLRTRGEHELRTIRTQQRAPLFAHGVGHHQRTLVAALCTHHGEPDTGVAARGFQNDGVGFDEAGISAASIIDSPIRSFTLCAGFWYSSLAVTSATQPAERRLMRTSGVLPMSLVTSVAMFMGSSLSTGQSTKNGEQRQTAGAPTAGGRRAGGLDEFPVRRLLHGIAAPIKARAHRSLVLRVLLRRDTSRRERWIVTGLAHCPTMTLIAISRLLLLALALPRIDKQLVLWRLCDIAGRRLLHDNVAGWRCDDGIALRALHIVHSVGVVVGHGANPNGAIERRQHGDHDADGRRDYDKSSRSLGAVPNASGKIELHTSVNHRSGSRR